MPAPLLSASQPPFFALKDNRFCTASFSFGHLYGAQYFCWPAWWRVASTAFATILYAHALMKASRARHPALSCTKHVCKIVLSRGVRGERDQWQEATHCSKSNDGWRAGLHLCAFCSDSAAVGAES